MVGVHLIYEEEGAHGCGERGRAQQNFVVSVKSRARSLIDVRGGVCCLHLGKRRMVPRVTARLVASYAKVKEAVTKDTAYGRAFLRRPLLETSSGRNDYQMKSLEQCISVAFVTLLCSCGLDVTFVLLAKPDRQNTNQI